MSQPDASSEPNPARRVFLSKPHMGGSERGLVDEVFEANMVAPVGPAVDRFERELEAYTGIAHAAALSSGSTALHLACILAGVEAGDEVWGPSLTFMGGVSGLVMRGAIPVFFDCAPESWGLDPSLLEAELSAAKRGKRLPKLVIATDLYGQSCDLDALLDVTSAHGVPLVTDSAEALGTLYKGRHAGKGALMAALSFNGNKIITTSGGGALLSDDGDLIARARFLATQARDPAPHYQHTTLGYNYRLSGVCAAIGSGQMQVLEQRVEQRRQLYHAYKSVLADAPVRFLLDQPDSRETHWLSVAFLDRHGPETLRLALEQDNIEARPVWKPMHLQPLFKEARFVARWREPDTNRAVCETYFDRGICLPSCSQLVAEEAEDFERVADALSRFF